MFNHFNKNKSKLNSKIKIDCAIFSAMSEELFELESIFSSYPFTDYTHLNFNFRVYNFNGYKVLLTPTGIGTVFAASTITMVSTLFALNCALFIGTSGAIDNSLNIRDIILVNSAFEAESQGMFSSLINTPFESCLTHPLLKESIKPKYTAHPALISLAESFIDSPIIKGGVVSSNSFPSPKELFPILKASNVLAIDMETSAFYQISWLLKIPCLAIRAISNKLDCVGDDKDVALSDISGSIKVASDYVFKLINVLARNTLTLVEEVDSSCSSASLSL